MKKKQKEIIVPNVKNENGKKSNRIIKKPSQATVNFIEKLDKCALELQKNPDDTEAFNKIHSSLHKYIIGQSFHRFIIKGHEGKDLYQEALIVLWQKAIPSFDATRGMSFFGFAKMCINRHLITILNSAMTRKRDMPMNKSISLDEIFGDEDEDTNCSLSNILEDPSDFLKEICFSEEKEKTVDALRETLSPFESLVLYYYLESMSYKEISYSISKVLDRKCNEKSVDNALLRIRRKAVEILGVKDLPLFKQEEYQEIKKIEETIEEDQNSEEIIPELKCSEKSIDNALTRIRKKAVGVRKNKKLPLFDREEKREGKNKSRKIAVNS